MKQDLAESLDSLVELVVRHRGVVKAQLVCHHEARLSTAGDDQVSEVSVVCLGKEVSRYGSTWSMLKISGISKMFKTLHTRLTFTLHWPVPSFNPFSNSLPKLIRICPLPLCASGAPGSDGTYLGRDRGQHKLWTLNGHINVQTRDSEPACRSRDVDTLI